MRQAKLRLRSGRRASMPRATRIWDGSRSRRSRVAWAGRSSAHSTSARHDSGIAAPLAVKASARQFLLSSCVCARPRSPLRDTSCRMRPPGRAAPSSRQCQSPARRSPQSVLAAENRRFWQTLDIEKPLSFSVRASCASRLKIIPLHAECSLCLRKNQGLATLSARRFLPHWVALLL